MKPLAHAALLACLSSPIASAASPAAAAQADEELLVVWSAGLDALLVDERDAGLERALGMLGERLAELGQDLGDPSFPADAVRLVHGLLSGPLCLRVERVEPAPGAAPVRAQLTLRTRDAETAERRLGELAAIADRAGVPLRRMDGNASLLGVPTPAGPIVLTTQADRLVIALGEPRAESFVPTATGLPEGVLPALHARWNGRGIGELLEPLMLAGDPEAEQLWGLMRMLGVVGEDAPSRTWSLGFARDRALVRTVATGATGGSAAGGEGAPALPRLEIADFARVPADATAAQLLQVRPRLLLALLDWLEPGAAQEAGSTLRAALGLDLGQLLDLFGPTAGSFLSMSTGGGGLASAVAFLECRDPAQVEAVLERLLAMVEGLGAGPAQGRVAVRAWERAGARGRTVVFPGLPVPLELALAVHGDALWVALRPDALVATFEAQASGRTLLDHPRLAPLAAEVPTDALSFRFLDAPYFLERGYGATTALAAALANALRSPYDRARDPGAILPPFAALRASARPSVSWSRMVGGELVGTTSFDRSWVSNVAAGLGTPVTQLYAGTMGIGMLGMVSSVAIPKLMGERLAANESAAIAALRSLASAQEQLRSSAVIDEDGDGVGEYGFLGELSGARPLRGPRGRRLQPPLLSGAFTELQDDGDGDVVVERSGYWIQVWLPAGPGAACTERTHPSGGARVRPDAAEQAWCAYAWPVEPGRTGLRAFFVNQEGEVLAFDNAGGTLHGLHALGGRQPDFACALTRADLASPPARGRRSAGGMLWQPLD